MNVNNSSQILTQICFVAIPFRVLLILIVSPKLVKTKQFINKVFRLIDQARIAKNDNFKNGSVQCKRIYIKNHAKRRVSRSPWQASLMMENSPDSAACILTLGQRLSFQICKIFDIFCSIIQTNKVIILSIKTRILYQNTTLLILVINSKNKFVILINLLFLIKLQILRENNFVKNDQRNLNSQRFRKSTSLFPINELNIASLELCFLMINLAEKIMNCEVIIHSREFCKNRKPAALIVFLFLQIHQYLCHAE